MSKMIFYCADWADTPQGYCTDLMKSSITGTSLQKQKDTPDDGGVDRRPAFMHRLSPVYSVTTMVVENIDPLFPSTSIG